MNFLKRFKKVQYDFTGLSGYASATDITANISISDVGKVSLYTKYIIKEGERPDIVSLKLYGDAKYSWILFLINPSLREGLAGWPLTDQEMDRMIAKEYTPYAWISGVPGSNSSSFIVPDLGLPDVQICNSSWVDTGWRVLRKDHNRMGLVVKRGSGSPTLSLSGSVIRFYDQDHESPDSWYQTMKAAGYPLGDLAPGRVEMTFDPETSYDLLENSTYQYYSLDSDGEPQSMTHYDALSSGLPAESLKRITWAEYEGIINDRKRYILVPREDAVEEISKQFLSLIQREV